jgi:hypothetical protein
MADVIYYVALPFVMSGDGPPGTAKRCASERHQLPLGMQVELLFFIERGITSWLSRPSAGPPYASNNLNVFIIPFHHHPSRHYRHRH